MKDKIKESIEAEIIKIKCIGRTKHNDIPLNSDLGVDVVFNVVKSLLKEKLKKDKDNYYYLKGFIDGQGSDGHKDSLPEEFNNINEVMDRMHELEGWKKDKETFDNLLEVITNKIINIEVGETKKEKQKYLLKENVRLF
jgi:hypothetical protein